MADIHIIEPNSKADFGDEKEEGDHHGNDCPYKITYHLAVVPFKVMIQAKTEYKDHEAIRGMDFHVRKIERSEGQVGKHQKLHDIHPGKKSSVSRFDKCTGIRYHHPFDKVDSDHAQRPSREFPFRCKQIKESMTDQTTP